MPFEDEVGNGQHQRVAGVHEHGRLRPRIIGCLDRLPLEADPVVALQHRFLLASVAAGDPSVTLADFVRDEGDLVAARLARMDRATEGHESPHEEGSHEARLEPAGLGLLHLFFHGEEPLGRHRLLGQGVAAEEVLQVIVIERMVDPLPEPGLHIVTVVVFDRRNEEVFERPRPLAAVGIGRIIVVKIKNFAEDVEDAAVESVALDL